MDDLKTRKRNLIFFPLGSVGRDMVYALVTNFLLTFILFTRSLTASQLAAITGIMIAARVFDALNDPIMGNIIERTRSKYGKFKPWLTIGIILTSIVVYLAFNTNLEGWSFVVFFAVIYFAYSIAYTMHDISYWGMIPALSKDGNARNQFTSRATLFAGIGSTLATILIPLLTTGSLAIGGSARTAYGRVALVIAVLAPAFLLFTILGAKEDRSDMETKAPPVSFKKIIGTIKGNDQLIWCSLFLLIQQIGSNIVLAGVGSTYIYFEFGYSGGLFSIFTTVGMSATAFLMIFYPVITRHLERKKLMKILMAIAVSGYIVMLVPGLMLPSSTVKFAIIVVGYMLSNFGQYGLYLIAMISILNTVEYNEFMTGNRDEGIIASLRPFITKLASAVTVLIATGSYMIFGITGFTNSISEYENAATQGLISESEKLSLISDVLNSATSGEADALLITMTLLPCILMLIAGFIYLRKYTIDEKRYDELCRLIAERKS